MSRNLRSSRKRKGELLKKDRLILTSSEQKLFKINEDWKNGDQTIKVVELIEVDSKQKSKLFFKCGGPLQINYTDQWIEIETFSLCKLNQETFIIDKDIFNQAVRSLLQESKIKLESTHKQLDKIDKKEQQTKKKNLNKEQIEVTQISPDSSSSSESYEDDSDSESIKVKQKQQRKTNQPKKVAKSKTTAKKNQQILTTNRQLKDTHDDFIDYQSSRMNNKEVIRAAMTGNKILMENIFNSEKKISNLEDRWGPENDVNVLEILLQRQDKELLTYFLENRDKVQLCSNQRCSLKEIHTGYNDKYAYGVRLRKVTLGRGCREGNNAFVYDLNEENQYAFYKIRKLLQIETDPQLFEQFLKLDSYGHYFLNYISQAVRCGNIKTAQYLLEYSQKNNQDGYGFNYLHLDALSANFSTYDLSQIKTQSITKRTTGDFCITPIHCACINPSAQFLQYFMEQTKEFNQIDENNRKPVHYAAVSSSSECLEYLLKNGVDPREGDKFLNTPLILAAKFGRTHNVNMLCSTNVKGKNKDGNAAIHLASQGGHIECVKLLLQNGVPLSFPGQHRMQPLHFACAYNHIELVDYLIKQKARLNAKDKYGRTPLIMAARNGNAEILVKLLGLGADFSISDSSKNTAIHYSAAYGFLECVELLIQAGANQNELNSWKLTPLNVALSKNHFSIVKALLKYDNTDVNCKDDDGLTLLAGLIQSFDSTQEKFEFIRYLIDEKNADINIPDKQGRTCLSHAMNGNQSQLQVDLIRLLIKRGADINNQEKDGSTPFLLSIAKKNYSLVKMLLEETYPNINVQNNSDKNIIHLLCENAFFFDEEGLNIFESIIDQIDSKILNVPDADGFVPLLRLIQVFTDEIESKIDDIFNKKIERRRQEILKQAVSQINFRDQDNNEKNSYQIREEIQKLLTPENVKLSCQQWLTHENLSSFKVGITLEEEDQFTLERINDGYHFQQRVIQIIKKLIERGATTNIKVIRQKHLRNNSKESEFEGSNIFHFIFENLPSLSLFKELVQIFPKAQIDEKNVSDYPIHCFMESIESGYEFSQQILYREDESKEKFLEYLLNQGLNILHKNSEENTPTLILAFKFTDGNFTEFLKKFISLGGTVNERNAENLIPLQYFIIEQEVRTVKIFLRELNADPNLQDKDGRTALHYAINYSNTDGNATFQMEQQLIRFGAKCDVRDVYNRTPLFYAFTKFDLPLDNSEIDPFESVSSLLAHKECDVNALDKYQRSPLHYAAFRGSAISGRYMIKMGAIADQPDEFNNAPLAYAFFKHANFSTMMIDNKVDVNKFLHIKSKEDLKEEKESYYQQQLKNDPDVEKLIADEIKQEKLKLSHKMEIENVTENNNQNDDEEEEENNEDEEEDDEEEEEEEDEESKRSNVSQEKNKLKNNIADQIRAKILSKQLRLRMEEDLDIPQLLSNNMKTGQYSYFTLAIKHGWQGVAYLLIGDGYKFVRAIEDAIAENQFQLVLTLLMKVKDESEIQVLNQFGQNLFHLFAQHARNVKKDLKEELLEELEIKNISPYLQDQHGKLPLHYAVEKNDSVLVDYFLNNRKCDMNIMDNSNNNAFTLQLQLHLSVDKFLSLSNLKPNETFQMLTNNKPFVKPLLYLIEHRSMYDCNILQEFISHGVDLNEQNDKGETAITFAIRNNNKQLLQFILEQPTFNKDYHITDKQGKSPIHHVVLPLEFGSYENIDMLHLLIRIFDYNTKDNQGLTPLDYALMFDSQIMKDELIKINASHTRSLKQNRMPTSIIATAQWPDSEIDFEFDAKIYTEKCEQQIEIEIDNKKIVDTSARVAKADLSVYEDTEYGLFQCLLSKVDIVNKHLHKNVFYKMQILYDKNRHNYILFTKWGKIGTDGQFQLTPFENVEATIKEFCKIFQQKTGGNDWKLIKRGVTQFEKKSGKYQLIELKNNTNFKSIIKPFDFSEFSPYPKCQLNQSISTVIEQFSQVKLYQQELNKHSFDMGFIPLEKLDKNSILKAKTYLQELLVLVKDVEDYKQGKEIDLKQLQQYYSEINHKTARFYEIIPQTQMRQSMLPILDIESKINQKLELVELLLNVEFSVKILLGAALKSDLINPITYCFNALNIKMLTLGRDDLEFKMIQAYAKQTGQARIVNIFAIERKGEAEAFSQHRNGQRYLLWHGSKISNFMSLLAMGLKIAPSWAINTGNLYGKGIYFADQFDKSYDYTQDHTLRNRSSYYNVSQQQDFQKFRFLLLCEVSASNQIDVYNDEQDLSQIIKPDVTIRVVGSKGPDQNSQIKMPNGCIVPIGKIVDNKIPDHLNQLDRRDGFKTSQTEYIVYNENKVRLRYLIQVE